MLVTLHVWRVAKRELGSTLPRMATEPRRLRALPGVRFAKVLGTGKGVTFGLGDADPTRFAALVAWDGPGDPAAVDRRWRHKVRLDLTPLSSRGAWAGRNPFEPDPAATETGPVLALTRARLRPAKALAFWRAIPAVAREVAAAPGLLARFGIGEAPIGWQG
ncbi:MAG TPA: monooxygenase, partial [Actinoplanes sp.]|nr:monooxygenase [Actinoplanes sp.]